jgi:putative GTP pyrophosphokinase
VEGYSKTKVDRAGRQLADRIKAGDGPLGEADLAARAVDWWGSESLQIVDWWRLEHVRALSTVASNLFPYVEDEGNPIVAQRLKRVPTIAGKLHREKGMKLSRMEDVGGVRAVLPDQEGVYRVARRLRHNWTITRVRDYVANPKPDGYRALHLVPRNRGRLIEVQLRTPNQDDWANVVEKAERIFPGMKTGSGPVELRELFTGFSEFFAAEDGSIDELTVPRLQEIGEALGRAGTFLSEASDDS